MYHLRSRIQPQIRHATTHAQPRHGLQSNAQNKNSQLGENASENSGRKLAQISAATNKRVDKSGPVRQNGAQSQHSKRVAVPQNLKSAGEPRFAQSSRVQPVFEPNTSRKSAANHYPGFPAEY